MGIDQQRAQIEAQQKYEFCERLYREANEDPSASKEVRERARERADEALAALLRANAAMQPPAPAPSEWNAALDAIVARFEDIDETAGWFVQDEARQMKRPEPPAPAWTREELEARAYEGRGDPEGAEQYAAKARAVQRIIDSGVRRVIDASVQRLIDQLRSEEPPTAPAWTREAPKAGPGFYWVRYDRHELLVAEFVVEAESSYWLTSGDLEEDPVDRYEHWPVRLEPPQ